MKNLRLFSKNTSDSDTSTGRSMILPILFCLVCGILLILFGSLAVLITAYVISGIMILCGIWSVISYMRSAPAQRIKESRLAVGLILLVAGMLLAFNPNHLDNLLPVIWGLALFFGSFLKIQYAFDEKSVGVNKWWIMLIFAAFSLTIGVLSLLRPGFLGENNHLIIGILLVLEAVLDITVCFLLRHALKKRSETDAPVTVAAPEPVSGESGSVQTFLQEPAQDSVPENEA